MTSRELCQLDALIPCRYKPCVSFRSSNSGYGYCGIHHQVATVEFLYNKALSGQISAPLKVFALDLQCGLYPKGF
jgi:hypothetical protein